MRVAVTAESPTPEGAVDPHLGRTRYLLIYDTKDRSWAVLDNQPNTDALDGAGVGLAEMLARNQVDVVLTGSYGPKAFQVLSAASIRVRDGATGTIAEAVDKFLSTSHKAEVIRR